MAFFVMERIGNCNRCEAEVEVWRTPKGKTMLVDPWPGLSYADGHEERDREAISDILDRFHYGANGKCTNSTGKPKAEAPREVYVKADSPPLGQAHLCRGCRTRVLEADHGGKCELVAKGGHVTLESWTRPNLPKDRPTQFARDFVQACTGFAPLSRPKETP